MSFFRKIGKMKTNNDPERSAITERLKSGTASEQELQDAFSRADSQVENYMAWHRGAIPAPMVRDHVNWLRKQRLYEMVGRKEIRAVLTKGRFTSDVLKNLLLHLGNGYHDMENIVEVISNLVTNPYLDHGILVSWMGPLMREPKYDRVTSVIIQSRAVAGEYGEVIHAFLGENRSKTDDPRIVGLVSNPHLSSDTLRRIIEDSDHDDSTRLLARINLGKRKDAGSKPAPEVETPENFSPKVKEMMKRFYKIEEAIKAASAFTDEESLKSKAASALEVYKKSFLNQASLTNEVLLIGSSTQLENLAQEALGRLESYLLSAEELLAAIMKSGAVQTESEMAASTLDVLKFDHQALKELKNTSASQKISQ